MYSGFLPEVEAKASRGRVGKTTVEQEEEHDASGDCGNDRV